jgi:hypothetical protein
VIVGGGLRIFARLRKEGWFRERLGLNLKHGVASHDTFQRIFALLNPKEFKKRFISWVRAVCKIDREIVNIDGKTICGSRNGENPPLHLVGAWASKNKLALGQKATREKSNEITAIPELLDILELKGCIITIDAMGTSLFGFYNHIKFLVYNNYRRAGNTERNS